MSMKKEDYQPPCVKCGGTCCGYVAIEIDRPKTKADYDHIRWYLVHKKVNVFIDHDKKWFVEFRTPCEFQSKNKRCNIYNVRPKICRDYGLEDGECEYHDSPYFMYFAELREFEKFLNKKKIDWKFKNLSD